MATATIGEVIEGDRLALVVTGVERTTDIGTFASAGSGDEFVVVELAAKNESADQHVLFSSFLQAKLRDADGYAYDKRVFNEGNTLGTGELVPGEVTRGRIVFEVPEGTGGLSLRLDLDGSVFSYTRADVDLSREATRAGRRLTQDLRVPVHEVGETLAFRGSRLTVHAVDAQSRIGVFTPDSGEQFLVADLTVGNRGDEEIPVSTFFQMAVKDGTGRTSPVAVWATGAMDRGFAQGQPVAAHSSRRGTVAFAVERDASPLYLAMDFDLLRLDDKQFVRLR
ncbi:MAG: DUF4352 domain-containing protein [Haloarculaceae archaeon]